MAHQFHAAEEFADFDHANLAGPLIQRTSRLTVGSLDKEGSYPTARQTITSRRKKKKGMSNSFPQLSE